MATLKSQICGVLLASALMWSTLGQEQTDRHHVQNSANNKDNQHNNLVGSDMKHQDLKRRFDSISRHSSFGALGKRQSHTNLGVMAADEDAQNKKRKFDSIADNSGRFGGFGKRERSGYDLDVDKDDRNVQDSLAREENEPLFLLQSNRSQLQVLPQDIVENSDSSERRFYDGSLFSDDGSDADDHLLTVFTPFSSASNQLLHKTPSSVLSENLDRDREVLGPIFPAVPLRRLKMRHFDDLYGNTPSYMKRKFDAISGNHRFSAFGKRVPSSENNQGYFYNDNGYGSQDEAWHQYLPSQANQNYPVFNDGFDKSRFNGISHSVLNQFGDKDLTFLNNKRKFDSISGISSSGSFGKREDGEKRRFDSISGLSSFGSFGKREDAEKRRFDSISGLSSFGSFGKREGGEKRKFDSISGISSFGSFGKRGNGEKRRFDSISGLSSFGSFGKRDDGEKRKFDSISGISSFGSFGKRGNGEKRRFDSISGLSSFGSFGKRDDGEKRKFDSISGISSFGSFGKRDDGEKRRFDSISGLSSFGSFGKRDDGEKRKFDSISGISSFGSFGKRDDGEKRRFDSISGISSFGSFGKRDDGEKRKFDSISGISSFGSFGKREEKEKRRFDSISGLSSFGSFGKREDGEKRKFDSISGISSFGSFGKREENEKRRFDSISGLSSFGSFGKREGGDKRKFDSISGISSFGSFGKREGGDKRRFDSISGLSSFGSFGKREGGDKRKFDSISGISSFGSFGKREDEEKRRFDSISGLSSFGSFGKREGGDKRRFDSISGLSSFGSFGKREDDVKKRSASTYDEVSFPTLNQLNNNRKTSEEDMPGNKKQVMGNSTNSNIQGKLSRAKRVARTNNEVEGIKAENGKGEATAAIVKRSAEGEITVNMADKDSSRGVLVKRSVDDLETSEEYNDFNKRRFDRISGASNFRSFGKRQDEDGHSDHDVLDVPVYTNTKFDQTEGGSALNSQVEPNNGFLTRSDVIDLADLSKRRFDRISSGVNGFGSFGKRRFDRIANVSPFGGFGKRRFDRIAGASSFGGSGKRRFDRIAGASSFGGFGKRRFDRIAGASSFGGFGKRRFDRIAGASSFGGFGKRRFDRIAGGSSFGGFGKRRFDRIAGASSFGGFGKRRFDRIADSSRFYSFGRKRNADIVDQFYPLTVGSTVEGNDFSDASKYNGENNDAVLDFKRRFDPIEHNSEFQIFGKRTDVPDEVSDEDRTEITPLYLDYALSPTRKLTLLTENYNPDLVNSNERTENEILSDAPQFPEPSKRHFDSIDHRSIFRRFGRLSTVPRLFLPSSSSDDTDEDGEDNETSYSNNNNDEVTINTQQGVNDSHYISPSMSRELLQRIALVLGRLFGLHTGGVHYQK